MAQVYPNNVWETSTTTGTADYALAGAVAGARPFSAAMANGDTVLYVAKDTAGDGWEYGTGTWVTGNTLQRTSVIASKAPGGSEGTAKVSWPAGTRQVYAAIPSEYVPKGSDAAAQRAALGLGDAATKNTGTAAGTVAAGDDSRITGAVQSGGALGTPASGTLTNCTGLPPAGLTFSATDKLAGRSSSGGGAGEEITCTAAGRALLDDPDAAAQLVTMGAVPSTRTFTAGYGLTGLGNLSADRTPAVSLTTSTATASSVNITASGSGATDVTSLSLPAGTYLLLAVIGYAMRVSTSGGIYAKFYNATGGADLLGWQLLCYTDLTSLSASGATIACVATLSQTSTVKLQGQRYQGGTWSDDRFVPATLIALRIG